MVKNGQQLKPNPTLLLAFVSHLTPQMTQEIENPFET